MTAGVATRGRPRANREAEYDALRKAGYTAFEAGHELRLSESMGGRYEELRRASLRMRSPESDGTYPAFADHDRHVGALLNAGGYLSLTKRRMADGRPIMFDARGAFCTPAGEPLGRGAGA